MLTTAKAHFSPVGRLLTKNIFTKLFIFEPWAVGLFRSMQILDQKISEF